MKNKKNKDYLKKIVDNFLVKKNGKNILKNIEKKNLINEGLIDSLDIFTLGSLIEKKIKKKITISYQKIFKKFYSYKKLINL